MKAKQVLGKDLMLFVDGEAIALATSCKLGVSAETIDTQSKDSGMWGEKGVKKLGWNCSSENCFSADAGINGYDELFALFVAAEPVDIAFGIPANKSNAMPSDGWVLPPKPYMGKAIITSLELNAPDGDKATFSISLDGTGELIGGDNSVAVPRILSVSINEINLVKLVSDVDFGDPVEGFPIEITGENLEKIPSFTIAGQTTEAVERAYEAIKVSKHENNSVIGRGGSSFSNDCIRWISIKGNGKVLFEWGTRLPTME